MRHRISLNRCCCAESPDPDPDPVESCANGWKRVYAAVVDSWHAEDSAAGQNTPGRLTGVSLLDGVNANLSGSPQQMSRETFYGPTEWFLVNPTINGFLLFQQQTLDWSKEGLWEVAFHGTSLFEQLLISGFFSMSLATNYSGDPVTLGASWTINSPCGSPAAGSGNASYPVPSYQFGVPMLGTSTVRLSFDGANQNYRVRIQTPTGAGGTDYDSGTVSYPHYFNPAAKIGDLEMRFFGDNRGLEYIEILNTWT